MFEFRPLLEQAESDGRLIVHRGESVKEIGDGVVCRLESGRVVEADTAVLALGTTPSSGAGLLPPDLVGERDGWPDLDERTLRYTHAPRVSVVGAAAALMLGPAARNIDGHRVATARVAASIAHSLRPERLPAVAGV